MGGGSIGFKGVQFLFLGNGDLTADWILNGTNDKVWWQCDKGPDHEWETTVSHRTFGGNGCPCCTGRKLSVTNSLATKSPKIAAQLHPFVHLPKNFG